MNIETTIKIFCPSCDMEMEEDGGPLFPGFSIRVRCVNPDCEKPSMVYVRKG